MADALTLLISAFPVFYGLHVIHWLAKNVDNKIVVYGAAVASAITTLSFLGFMRQLSS